MTDATRKHLHELLDKVIDGRDDVASVSFELKRFPTLKKTHVAADDGVRSIYFTCPDSELRANMADTLGSFWARSTAATMGGVS